MRAAISCLSRLSAIWVRVLSFHLSLSCLSCSEKFYLLGSDGGGVELFAVVLLNVPLDGLISVLDVSKLKPGFFLLLLMPGPIRSFPYLSLSAGFKVFGGLYIFPDQADVQSAGL